MVNIPGFTAEASLYHMHRHYHCIARSGFNTERQEVISQLQDSVLPARGGGVFGPIIDIWNCIQGCESAYSSCLESCEGAGSLHCVTCDEDYRACQDGCSRGGVGGGGISIA
jgi:hypothetical protein